MKTNEYNIDDMISMFGDRIKNVTIKFNDNSMGIDAKKMAKLIEKWKFWNKDIREAYKKYYGMILAPYIIVNEPPILIADNNNPSKYYDINKEIFKKYSKSKINPDFYSTIKNIPKKTS